MCKQDYVPCLNTHCEGTAQVRDVHPCAHAPNCEIQFVRVRRVGKSDAYCPDCKALTPRERKSQRQRAARKNKRAKAQSAKAQKGKVTGHRAHSGMKKQGESSAMGESRGAAVGGSSLSNPDDSSSTSEESEETEYSDDTDPDDADPDEADPDEADSDDTISLPEDEKFGSYSNVTNPQKSRRIEPVSDSDETVLDPADEENTSMDSSRDIVPNPQGTNPGVIAPTNPAGPIVNIVPVQPNVSSAPPWRYQPPAGFQEPAVTLLSIWSSPELTERIALFNAELATISSNNVVGHPHDDATGPRPIALGEPIALDTLTTLGDPITLRRPNHTGTHPPTARAPHMASPELDVNPSSSAIPIDPVLLHMDQNAQDEQFLRQMCDWDESSKSKEPSEKTED
ncbi:hypothetical protein MMC22_008716 [Lobaria immixta]|nr:hypothetical protein [Lobaria immixta]